MAKGGTTHINEDYGDTLPSDALKHQIDESPEDGGKLVPEEEQFACRVIANICIFRSTTAFIVVLHFFYLFIL